MSETSLEKAEMEFGRSPDRKGLKNPILRMVVLTMITMTALGIYTRRIPEPPPILYKVPAFSLVSQSGTSFGSQDLQGEVYIANLIFTSCQTVCPMIMKATSDLQKRFALYEIPIKIVSISVDPENDTPARLLEYGKTHGADFSRWTFLTGPEDQIKSLVVDGFKLHAGERTDISPSLYDIAHATKLVLVDAEGNVRGYYDSDSEGVDEVFHRSQHVLWSKK